MTTTAHKPVRRRLLQQIRDKSKYRNPIVTIYPGGYIGIRLQGCRREETYPVESIYERAIRARLAVEKMEKAKDKKRPYYAKRGRL